MSSSVISSVTAYGVPGVIALLFAPLVGITLVLGAIIVSRKIREPHKSWAIHGLNVLLYVPMWLRLGPFKHKPSINGAVRSAMRKLKASEAELGGMAFVESYAKIVDAKDVQRQRRTPLGFVIAKDEVTSAMIRRIHFNRFLKDVPEVERVPLKRPIFVMGLPRTGTSQK